jgi:serine phosphatase RsbU (regulator of sigma subunit)
VSSLSTYRPAALISLVLSTGAFFAVVFQILYRALDIVPIPSQIDHVILQSTVVLFLFSSVLFAKYWTEGIAQEYAWETITRAGSVAIGLSLILIPEYIYIFYPVQLAFPAYTQLYLFVQVFFTHLYLVLLVFYFRKILPKKLIGLKRIVWQAFLILLALSLLGNFTKNLVPNFLRSFNISLVFVLGTYLTLQLKWVVDIPASKRIATSLWLLFITALNLFLVFHYYTEESHGFFNILSLPTEYYLSLLLLPMLFSLLSLFANVFYMPLAKVVDQKENEIRSLTQMSKFIQNKENLDGVFNFLLNNCVHDTEATAGWILLQNDEQKETLKSKNINIDRATVITQSFLENYGAKLKTQIHLNIYSTTATMPQIKNIGNYSSLLAFEIALGKGEWGKLFLIKEDEEGFDDHQVELVHSYIGQAKIAYENQRLFLESVKSESVKREVELASHIHKNLLPKHFPQHQLFEIAGFIEPSKELGGDFFDYFHLDDDRLALVIGDVSGKGMPAALYMAEIKGIFQSLAQFNLSPEEVIYKANETISDCFDKSHFVTLAYVVIDKKNHKFLYVRCGHCPLLYYNFKTNQTNYFEDQGIGLGIVRTSNFKQHINLYEKEFHKNDMLVLYTDGLIEAVDKKTQKSYGFNELIRSLETARKITVTDTMKDLLSDFNNTISVQENPDDLAIIVIKFL